jgi:O-antigen ligase
MIVFVRSGVYIDDIIWQYVSINKSIDPTNVTWAVLGIPRGIGFPGVNSAATYNVLAIPLLLAYYFKDRSKYILIALLVIIAGILVTLSRTGILGFIISVFIYLYLERKKVKYFFGIVTGFGLLITGLFFYYKEYINAIVDARSGIDWTRIGLFKGGLNLISENLIFGVGINNYSVVNKTIMDTQIIDDNLHNSWLSIFVETGLIGLLIFIFFMFYILWVSNVKKTFCSNALISTLIGAFFGGLTNSLFDNFYFNFWLVLIFANVIIDNEYYHKQIKIRPIF